MSRVIIIGGGVIGLCAAWYALQDGHSVTIIDRQSQNQDGCSFGNAGMIVPSHFTPIAAPGAVWQGLKWMRNPESPFYIKPRLDLELLAWAYKFWKASSLAQVQRASPLLRDLHLASRACFEELANLRGNDFGLVKKGLLMLCHTEQALHEEKLAAQHSNRLGVPAEILSPEETARLDPGVRMNIAGSVYFPKDCHLSPHRFMSSMKSLLLAQGVIISYSTEMEGWETASQNVSALRTSKGLIEGDQFVLSGGAWSSRVARPLGLNLPLQAGKGYSLTLPNPRQIPQICAIFTEARVAVTPMGGNLRIGGTMEMAGLNEETNLLRVQGIIKSVPKYYPDFQPCDFLGIEPWRGLRPCSPDGLPYLGKPARYNNLIVATGHAMMGLSLGPISGKIVADLLANRSPSISLDLLRPDRFN